MKPYTNNLDELSYFADDHELTDGGQHPIQRGDFLLSELVNFTTVDEHHAISQFSYESKPLYLAM